MFTKFFKKIASLMMRIFKSFHSIFYGSSKIGMEKPMMQNSGHKESKSKFLPNQNTKIKAFAKSWRITL